jgi:hypothetical protein
LNFESERVMEELISLFRDPDPDGGYASPSAAEPIQASLKVISDEPIYFQQLLEYLRQEKEKDKSGAD